VDARCQAMSSDPHNELQLQVPPADTVVCELCVAPTDNQQATESAGLSFVDLLYAVPVAALATRLGDTELSNLSASSLSDVAVVLAAITFGWIGHHTNRKKVPGPAVKQEEKQPFTTLRFPQLLVEILIIVAYFALSYEAFLPNKQGQYESSRSVLGKADWLAIVFALYLVWDLLDIHIAAGFCRRWTARAIQGVSVTLPFALLYGAAWYLAEAHHHHKWGSLVFVDILTLLVLLAYRVIQERVHLRPPRRLQEPPGWLHAVCKRAR
jgi:tryptophan-rich sensory protein